MKTLNDILRDEFNDILNENEFNKLITSSKLDNKIINNAFEILLDFKHNTTPDRGRTEFENYIINTIKSIK